MPDLVVVKDQNGRMAGLSQKDSRAWEKFRRVINEMEVGECFHFSYRLPRSPQHHRFFFKRLTALFERQEVFPDMKHLLTWLKVGAGFVKWMPGPDGQPVAIPKSIAWGELEEKDFTEVHQAMRDFLWTEYAQKTLWPHLDADRRFVMLDQWEKG